MHASYWPLLPVVFVLVLTCLMWLGSFLRRDGALPFLLFLPTGIIGWFLVLCAGIVGLEFTGEPLTFLLVAPVVGWVVSMVLLRLLPDRLVSLSESLLIASAGWMPVMGLMYLLLRFLGYG